MMFPRTNFLKIFFSLEVSIPHISITYHSIFTCSRQSSSSLQSLANYHLYVSLPPPSLISHYPHSPSFPPTSLDELSSFVASSLSHHPLNMSLPHGGALSSLILWITDSVSSDNLRYLIVLSIDVVSASLFPGLQVLCFSLNSEK